MNSKEDKIKKNITNDKDDFIGIGEFFVDISLFIEVLN